LPSLSFSFYKRDMMPPQHRRGNIGLAMNAYTQQAPDQVFRKGGICCGQEGDHAVPKHCRLWDPRPPSLVSSLLWREGHQDRHKVQSKWKKGIMLVAWHWQDNRRLREGMARARKHQKISRRVTGGLCSAGLYPRS
jgi:hypothetical protein